MADKCAHLRMAQFWSAKQWFLVAFVCLLVPGTVGAGKRPRRLVNSEYRFSVEAPAGAVTCWKGAHGFSILLGSGSGGCKSRVPEAHVGVFGDYNAAFEATPLEALRDLCPDGAVWADKSGLRLTFPGRASAVCRKNRADGWVDIYVAAQAGQWGKGFGEDSRLPYINYTAELQTRAWRFGSDLKVFRRILSSVHIDEAVAGPSAGREVR